MAEKIIPSEVVTKCAHCQYADCQSDGSWICFFLSGGRVIQDEESIPAWCELEDASLHRADADLRQKLEALVVELGNDAASQIAVAHETRDFYLGAEAYRLHALIRLEEILKEAK